MLSDAELIQAVMAGDRESFEPLIRRYERTVCAVAADVLNDRHMAQDVAQEVFITAYKQLGTLRDPAAFGPWTMRIARRQAVQWAKKRSLRTNVEPLPESAAPSDNGQLDDASAALLNAIGLLPGHERRVVMLKHFDGHEVSAIAEITGRPVGTVTKQLSRAYARLRERLKDVD